MLEIALDADEEWDSSRSWEQLARGAAEAAVAESAFPQLATSERLVEVSVRLSGDEQVRALNAQWRGKDKPTNVLSFAALDGARPKPGMPWLLGDVVLTSGVIAREAKAQHKSLQHHLSHLAVHGVLHLLGYDHEQDRDAEAMEALEVAALAGMGIANPYEMRR